MNKIEHMCIIVAVISSLSSVVQLGFGVIPVHIGCPYPLFYCYLPVAFPAFILSTNTNKNYWVLEAMHLYINYGKLLLVE